MLRVASTMNTHLTLARACENALCATKHRKQKEPDEEEMNMGGGLAGGPGRTKTIYRYYSWSRTAGTMCVV